MAHSHPLETVCFGTFSKAEHIVEYRWVIDRIPLNLPEGFCQRSWRGYEISSKSLSSKLQCVFTCPGVNWPHLQPATCFWVLLSLVCNIPLEVAHWVPYVLCGCLALEIPSWLCLNGSNREALTWYAVANSLVHADGWNGVSRTFSHCA